MTNRYGTRISMSRNWWLVILKLQKLYQIFIESVLVISALVLEATVALDDILKMKKLLTSLIFHKVLKLFVNCFICCFI